MDFDEYRELINSDDVNTSKIFNLYLTFLNDFSQNNFPFNMQMQLSGAGGKFIKSIERTSYIDSQVRENYFRLIDTFLKSLRYYRHKSNSSLIRRFFFPHNSNKNLKLKLEDSFQELYSNTLELYNEATKRRLDYDSFDINGFYKPDNTNKEKIKELIIEAIDLINEDKTLTSKSKKTITEYLEKVIKELERERINWTKIIGRIKETIIVLGALGSFIGGGSSLLGASEKLEQTTIIIQNTSININHNILNETFHIQNINQLNTINKILSLQEKEIEDVEEINENE